ncbi:hypothetical protein [Novosphingobium sp.]|uniref:hypothetical protein n=1 Tax=Novosphingobium sp. TaxID=1874826 RepID=UPI0038B8DDC9
MRAQRPLADRFRAAREAFVLGCQLGCTPAQARDQMRQRESNARWQETERRLAARAAQRPAPSATFTEITATPADLPRPWWHD